MFHTNSWCAFPILFEMMLRLAETGDRAMFDTLLEEVMDAVDPLPEARLANTMARERASMYIENADQLF